MCCLTACKLADLYYAHGHLHASVATAIGKGFVGGLNRVVGWTPPAASCMHPLLPLLFLPDVECSVMAVRRKITWKNISRSKLVEANYAVHRRYLHFALRHHIGKAVAADKLRCLSLWAVLRLVSVETSRASCPSLYSGKLIGIHLVQVCHGRSPGVWTLPGPSHMF